MRVQGETLKEAWEEEVRSAEGFAADFREDTRMGRDGGVIVYVDILI